MRTVLLLTAVLVGCGTGTPPPASALASDSTRATAGPPTVTIDSLLVSVDSLRYTVAIGYPQIPGGPEAVNAAIRDSVVSLAERFRPEKAVPDDARPSEVAEVQGGTDETFVGGDVLSALVSVYAFTGGAHGNTYFQPVNVDLRTGAPIRIGDLFRTGTPWADSLSAHAGRALTAKFIASDAAASPATIAETFYPEGFAADAMRRATFTLGRDSLAIHFVPYEVAYYAFGSTRVPIAYADLDALLKPDGAVARIRADR